MLKASIWLLLGSLLTACTFDVSTWPKWRFDAGLDAGSNDGGAVVDSGVDAGAGRGGAAGVAGEERGGVGGVPAIGGQGGETQGGSGADPDPTAGQGGGGTGSEAPQAGTGGGDSSPQAGQGGALEPQGGQGGMVSTPDLLSPEVTVFSLVNEQGFSTVASGETLLGSVTYHNLNDQPFTVQQIVIAGRPPGGTHAGGPYLDLMPIRSTPLTIPAGESITYNASRTMRVTDPLGVWEFYPTWQSADNAWHDGASVHVEVVRLPREDDQDGGT